MNKLKGRIAWVFGDHFDVDLITGVQSIGITDVDELVDMCMKDFDVNFIREVRQGDVLVAGRNFGYGHPHRQGMMVMRHLGIRAILARSFARNFFKNEIAAGSVLLPCPDLPDYLKRWDEVEADLEQWCVSFLSTGDMFPLAKIPPVEVDIMKLGGIVPYLKR
jgi:3-isopropylmalate/(R)-2-methylmalate dehydratase small subunit